MMDPTERDAAELRRQWARLDDVMKSIADPSSQEGAIARRAFERLTVLTSDLQLDMSVMELAHQVPLLHPPLPRSVCAPGACASPHTPLPPAPFTYILLALRGESLLIDL